MCLLIQFPIYIVPRLKNAAQFVKTKKEKMVRWMELKKARKNAVTSLNPAEETLLTKDGQKTEEED